MRGTHDKIKQKAKQLSTEEVLADLAQPLNLFELWSDALLCQRYVQPAIHLSDADAGVQYGKDVDVQATEWRGPICICWGRAVPALKIR